MDLVSSGSRPGCRNGRRVHPFSKARVIKLKREGEARALRRGPTLHEFSLSWLDRYAGTGTDSVRENTRREYRRLLVNFALSYFDREAGHHSPAFTLETYGHLIDGDLGPALDLRQELPSAKRRRTPRNRRSK